MNTRNFALITGIVFLAIGILGFIPGLRSMPPGHAPQMAVDAAYGYLFGLFPINILHNIVHIAIGGWGLAAYRSPTGARTFARGLTIIYGLFAVMGLIPGLNNVGGLVPLFSHDIWLHAVTAAIAAYFGYFQERVPVTNR